MANGWYKAQDFSDYIKEVIGEINFNFISIQVILTTIPPSSGDYGQELKKKRKRKTETEYYDSLEFWVGTVSVLDAGCWMLESLPNTYASQLSKFNPC